MILQLYKKAHRITTSFYNSLNEGAMKYSARSHKKGTTIDEERDGHFCPSLSF